MAELGDSIFKAVDLTKRFGGLVALNGLDLDIKERSIHSIIGPNGAGKTTVFNCIMNLFPIDGGELWFNGHRADGVTPDRVAKAGIGRTYQNIRLFRNMTSIENILVGMHIHLKSHWWGAVARSKHTRENENLAMEEATRLLTFVGMSDTVTVLDHGEKISEGPPAHVQKDPKVIEAYLGAGATDAQQY